MNGFMMHFMSMSSSFEQQRMRLDVYLGTEAQAGRHGQQYHAGTEDIAPVRPTPKSCS